MTISKKMMEVLKASPVWKVGWAGIYKDNEDGAICPFHEVEMEHLHGDWVLICTYIDHIAARAELFEGAPSEADGYVFCDSDKDLASLWKIGDKFMNVSAPVYGCFSTNDIDGRQLILRPTDEEMKILEDSKKSHIGDTPEEMKKGTTPWVPEIWAECGLEVREGRHIGAKVEKFDWCKIVFISDDHVLAIINDLSGAEVYEYERCFNRHLTTLTPLKTEREKFIERGEDILANDSITIANYLDRLFDNGARFTEGG